MKDKEFIKYLAQERNERVRMKIAVDKGNVIDIVVQYETFLNNKWVAVIRYDCVHGFFHRDILSPTGEKVKQTIAIQKLENALLYAEQDIKDRWKLYKQRYMKKLKK